VGDYIPLPFVVSSQKTVIPFLVLEDVDISGFTSNLFSIEWPKGSNKFQEFPEVDKIEWSANDIAMIRIHKYLQPVLRNALEYLS
ncbi:MAG: NUDIX hydrolase, partial [Deltaproteobacteria bacterium]|nr:NUDIX hydrolase [Deltaproteobacteria bacterium]